VRYNIELSGIGGSIQPSTVERCTERSAPRRRRRSSPCGGRRHDRTRRTSAIARPARRASRRTGTSRVSLARRVDSASRSPGPSRAREAGFTRIL